MAEAGLRRREILAVQAETDGKRLWKRMLVLVSQKGEGKKLHLQNV